MKKVHPPPPRESLSGGGCQLILDLVGQIPLLFMTMLTKSDYLTDFYSTLFLPKTYCLFFLHITHYTLQKKIAREKRCAKRTTEKMAHEKRRVKMGTPKNRDRKMARQKWRTKNDAQKTAHQKGRAKNGAQKRSAKNGPRKTARQKWRTKSRVYEWVTLQKIWRAKKKRQYQKRSKITKKCFSFAQIT